MYVFLLQISCKYVYQEKKAAVVQKCNGLKTAHRHLFLKIRQFFKMTSLCSDFSRGKGRTQVSLLPRSLHRQNTPQVKTENGTAAKQQDGMNDGVQAENSTIKPLSNEDFAKMLLKK